MILYAEHGFVAMAETLQRLVVQIDVREFDRILVERIGINRESMIVRSDLYFLSNFVDDRMIRASMPELQLVGLPSQRQTQNLVTEADAEHRFLADQLANLLCLKLERLGIAGPVRQKHSVGLESEHVFDGC